MDDEPKILGAASNHRRGWQCELCKFVGMGVTEQEGRRNLESYYTERYNAEKMRVRCRHYGQLKPMRRALYLKSEPET